MNKFPEFNPSISDGCTGVRDWARHCCVEHDKRYWYGTTEADRKHADKKLRECIQEYGRKLRFPYNLGYWTLGWTRWAGVRVLGKKAFYNKEHKQ